MDLPSALRLSYSWRLADGRGLAALAGLGSVSAHCVSELACPVICVKKAEALSALEERPPARLCIAVDNTTHSHQMLQWAADKLLHDHEELHLVTVCQTAMPELNCYPPAVTSDMSTEVTRPEKSADRMEVHTVLMREAHRALDKALAILHSHGVSRLSQLTIPRDPCPAATPAVSSVHAPCLCAGSQAPHCDQGAGARGRCLGGREVSRVLH